MAEVIPLRRDPEIERIAKRVANLLDVPAPARLLPAAFIAGVLSVPVEWVEEHAVELGAVWLRDELGEGLRFDVRGALHALGGGQEPGRLRHSRDRRRDAANPGRELRDAA